MSEDDPKKGTHIIVPIDFSLGGVDALHAALQIRDKQIRDKQGGSVVALNVVRAPTRMDGSPSWTEAESARRLLEARELTRAFLTEQGIDDVEAETIGGDPAPEIASYAAKIGAELIVMPAHGKNWMDRLVVGSVTERVSRFARCPVLILPPPSRAKRSPQDWSAIQRVVVPYDFTDYDARALRYARRFVQDDAQLTAVHVAPLPSPPVLDALWSPFDPGHVTKTARNFMAKELTKHGFEGARADARAGHVGPELLDAIETEEAELVVVASHGRSGLGRLLIGSVAEGLVRGARCPVMVIHFEDTTS